MRRSLWVLAGAMMLAGCQLSLPGGTKAASDVSPITGGEVEVTSLDASEAQAAPTPDEVEAEKAQTLATPTPAPKPRPEASPAEKKAPDVADDATPEETAVEEPPPPPVVKSPAQIACERKKGVWTKTAAGNAAFCQTPTRDGGKFCRKSTDCEGYCLARSQTCAPVTPLFGCQEILNEDGRVLTQCIN